jgi:DNA polymerase-3 subunit alpha
MRLQEWINLHRLDASISSNICTIDGKKLLILEREDDKDLIFDQDFDLSISSVEQSILIQSNINQVLFEFGNNWYYSDTDNIKLNIFKYIGKEKSEFDFQFPYLGIHGEYDLCNGSRQYKDWCIKAKFLNSKSLGICENNTLGGTLSFQMACKDAGIKSILGETITVSKDKEKLYTYQVKLYVIDYDGWINLLNINSQIKVFNNGFVLEEYLLEHSTGLVCVISPSFDATKLKKYQSAFNEDLYCQIDFVEWLSIDKEKSYLKELKQYIDNGLFFVKPVIICDSYYLDKQDGYIKKILNQIGKVGFQNQSTDQYFKSTQDIYIQIEELVSEEQLESLFFDGIENANQIDNKCNFEIKLGELHLPEYEMTDEEKLKFETNEDLFFSLIENGLSNIELFKEEEEYLKRIEIEVDVIKRGNLIDYFLILWDIINWCINNNILTGPGRGSAAGSLISYLLNITQIDPLKFDLLFERFLNESRIGKSLPDIDFDVPSNRRDDVKRYMELKYGKDHVASIGTYGTFKIKSGIKDISRVMNLESKKVNYVTSMIDEASSSFTDFFKMASTTPILKEFIQNNNNIIEAYPLLENQAKNTSIHAAGVIIVPKTYNGRNMTIYDWMPVKIIDDILVSEWEGTQLDAAGFLKEDILGIKQLEKFADTINYIEKHHNKKIILNKIPLDDKDVYELFQGGNTEDVFQLGTVGLKGYCRELLPTEINDLTAAVSLYRPGPMDSGIHETYIKIKNGERTAEYDYMLEEITKDTYGLVIYQEQVMQAMQVLGKLSLVEADGVRKAIGKKDLDKMNEYKEQFIKGAIENKCDKYNAIAIWNKLEAFARYSFNKSHAAAYAHIGFFCQWFKYHYPIEFWAVSLNHSKPEEISKRISEMNKISEVRVLPPDINKSTSVFEVELETKSIYWAIGSIKFVGDVALSSIMNDRATNGKFFSFDDFYSRIEKRKVNKRCVSNLILAGCFDGMEKIESPSKRITLLKRYLCDIVGDDLPEEFADTSNNWKDYFWILKQKELTGFGYLEFDKIYKNHIYSKIKNKDKIKLLDVDSMSELKPNPIIQNMALIGILNEIVTRVCKNGQYAQLTINNNDEHVICIIWPEIWDKYKTLINMSKNKIICVIGDIKPDHYRNKNQMQTNQQSQIEIL